MLQRPGMQRCAVSLAKESQQRAGSVLRAMSKGLRRPDHVAPLQQQVSLCLSLSLPLPLPLPLPLSLSLSLPLPLPLPLPVSPSLTPPLPLQDEWRMVL